MVGVGGGGMRLFVLGGGGGLGLARCGEGQAGGEEGRFASYAQRWRQGKVPLSFVTEHRSHAVLATCQLPCTCRRQASELARRRTYLGYATHPSPPTHSQQTHKYTNVSPCSLLCAGASASALPRCLAYLACATHGPPAHQARMQPAPSLSLLSPTAGASASALVRRLTYLRYATHPTPPTHPQQTHINTHTLSSFPLQVPRPLRWPAG